MMRLCAGKENANKAKLLPPGSILSKGGHFPQHVPQVYGRRGCVLWARHSGRDRGSGEVRGEGGGCSMQDAGGGGGRVRCWLGGNLKAVRGGP